MTEKLQIALITAVRVSGISHIFVDHDQKSTAIYSFNPFTMLLILILTTSRFPVVSYYYNLIIIIGLSIFVANSISMIRRQVTYIPGLISFYWTIFFILPPFAFASACYYTL